jgi:hypothetical protein
MDAADGTGPRLEALEDNEDTPHRKPKPERPEREYEMERVAYSPAPEYPRKVAGGAKHRAALLVVRGNKGRFLELLGLFGDVGFPNGVFFHGGTVRRSAARAKAGEKRSAVNVYPSIRAQRAAAMPQIARIIGVIQTP